MRVGIDYGREHLELDVSDSRFIGTRRKPAALPLPDPAQAVRDALEKPLEFPALRQALTPDDHVTVVVDHRLPCLPKMLEGIIGYLVQAGIAEEAITLLYHSRPDSAAAGLHARSSFPQVRAEVHEPGNRKMLSYLATTKKGRRIYLNRSAVDADQLVVLARRGYDPLLGYSGSVGAIYPALSDEETCRQLWSGLSNAAPGIAPWPVRQEAGEVAWLLGAPFIIQVIEGSGEEIIHVLGGLADTSKQGEELLNSRWRVTVNQAADIVIASLAGDPQRHGFAEIAKGLACAARVVKPEGRILLLSQARPPLGKGGELLRQAGEPEQALALLRDENPPDMEAAFQWASAVDQATVYLLSGLPQATAEELFTVPFKNAAEINNLLKGNESCLFLADAHKTMAVVDTKTPSSAVRALKKRGA
jgi:nickel-dependent lactate racemase